MLNRDTQLTPEHFLKAFVDNKCLELELNDNSGRETISLYLKRKEWDWLMDYKKRTDRKTPLNVCFFGNLINNFVRSGRLNELPKSRPSLGKREQGNDVAFTGFVIDKTVHNEIKKCAFQDDEVVQQIISHITTEVKSLEANNEIENTFSRFLMPLNT